MDLWHTIGFTGEDIIIAWQDVRLSTQCVKIWREAGRPAEFQVLALGGDDHHMVLWFISDAAAQLLDAAGSDWRRFLLGTRGAPPPHATPVLLDPTEKEAAP